LGCLQEAEREAAHRTGIETQPTALQSSSSRIEDELRAKLAEDFAGERQQKEREIQQLSEVKDQLRVEADHAVGERDEWKRKHEEVVARQIDLYKERSQWRKEIPGVENITENIMGASSGGALSGSGGNGE